MASQELSSKGKDLVVFWLVNESACSECGEDLGRGQFLRLENDRPLCMACADLEHLLFLPRGDAALTRRAGKHSRLRAVVVRFSRTRKRYERQGILVDEDALKRAEEECLADAEARALARERASEQRARIDLQYVTAFAERVRELFPGCPSAESGKIAQHACLLRSGRIGRSASAKRLDPHSIELAVRAHIRHAHTPYDRLLSRGLDRQQCRLEVAGMVEEVLMSWQEKVKR